MFDVAWSEMLIIGAVALIVIGPKDLPKALRTLGQMVGKVRRMASEFQGQFNDAMREAELHDIKKTVEGLGDEVTTATKTDFNPIQTIRDEIRGATDQKPADPTPGDAKAAAINAEAEALMKADAALANLPLPQAAPVSLPTPDKPKPGAAAKAAPAPAPAAPPAAPAAPPAAPAVAQAEPAAKKARSAKPAEPKAAPAKAAARPARSTKAKA